MGVYSTRPSRRLGRPAAFAAGAVAAAALGGCYSADWSVYESTPWLPVSLTLKDTRTMEDIWAVDVPVGYKVIVGFDEGAGPNEYNPAIMKWEMMEAERNKVVLSNRMACPDHTSRRLEPSYREAPELPNAPLPGSPFNETN